MKRLEYYYFMVVPGRIGTGSLLELFEKTALESENAME